MCSFRAVIFDHTIRGALSPPHASRAPGFTTQDHLTAFAEVLMGFIEKAALQTLPMTQTTYKVASDGAFVDCTRLRAAKKTQVAVSSRPR